MEAGGDKPKKTHKKRISGIKAKKKKEKRTGKVEKHNPKAHTFSGGTQSVAKRVRYALEKQEKKEHAPKVDKTPSVPPPFIVVVQGPPGVGKTTLIQSLVKHYARQRLLHMNGPVTLVSGRHRRITLVECPQDMAAMLDLAKVADMVLMLIDAAYGFELETFEFINILQVHGFPKVMGVLTHLDHFKDGKTLRKMKKMMKRRFQTELFEGAKLFHLSGLQYGRYHRVEVQNLARFISVTKAPMLSWRQNHPYMLALRWEDQTHPATPAGSPRSLDLYGYVYGGRLREGTQAHLAGVGDFPIATLKALPDPCPPPEAVESQRIQAKDGKEKKKNALRTLAERHRLVYAPGSDVGSITVDSDTMFITLPEHTVGFTERDGEATGNQAELPEAVRMVRALQSRERALDNAMAARPGLRLVRDAMVQLPKEDDKDMQSKDQQAARKRRRAPEDGFGVDNAGEAEHEEIDLSASDGDNEGEEEEKEEDEDDEHVGDAEGAAHRNAVLERARRRFERPAKLAEVIYGSSELSKSKKGLAGRTSKINTAALVSQQPTDHAVVPLFDDDNVDDSGVQLSEQLGTDGLLGNLGDVDGLDTAFMATLPSDVATMDDQTRESLKARKFITGGWSSAEEEDVEQENTASGKGADQATMDPEKSSGAQGGSGVDGLVAFDSFIDGMPIASFVRVRLEDVPAACVAELKRNRPLLLGGLLAGESQLGLVQVRLKRHRWHPKLLKSSDALLLSVGWRRFQTLPTFSLEDRGEKRMRYLKYSLEHAHCTMTAYCPMMPPNTGVLAFRSWEKVSHFRVCGTGVVLESAPNFQIMKKLKLVGEPYKIFKNSSFIKNMFNSDLEVAKYMHSKVQTVSGIRGEIKKAEGTRGQFRATFEDRILMSDLVVCKCWIRVTPKPFYHPVIDVPQWRPAKSIGQLRVEAGVPVPDKRDSNYGKQFVRAERRFNPLKISKRLQNSLPFDRVAKLQMKARKNLRDKAAVVPTDRERAVNSLLNRLYTVRKEKERIRTQANTKRKALAEKRQKFIQDKRDSHQKESKKLRYIKEGQEQSKKRQRLRLED